MRNTDKKLKIEVDIDNAFARYVHIGLQSRLTNKQVKAHNKQEKSKRSESERKKQILAEQQKQDIYSKETAHMQSVKLDQEIESGVRRQMAYDYSQK